ncbi:hypothetical protein LguiA_020344 [Lonicera macranthoides]
MSLLCHVAGEAWPEDEITLAGKACKLCKERGCGDGGRSCYHRRRQSSGLRRLLWATSRDKKRRELVVIYLMEDEREEASETLIRRSKRTRIHTSSTADVQPSKANVATDGVNDGRTSNRREQSPTQEEMKETFDDLDELPPKAKRNRPTTHGPDQPLIEVIKGNGKLIPEMVKLWVEHFDKDPKHATVELLMMLFEACGAKYQNEQDFLDESDVDDVVVALVNLARSGEVDDCQSSKKEFKNFRDNLVSFWDNLVIECQNGPLFDQVLFDKCMDYIIALSCTPPRVYRQVASLMGLQLVTSFIKVAKVLGAHRETTQRQLNAEKKKRLKGPRVESLDKRLSVTHEKITMTEEMMRKIFTGLFVHRYRDIDPDIRISCIQSLGVWILSYPSLFLWDLYLKYLGWTLNDKSAGVRKASILALQNLYEVDDNVPSLGLFTERFYKRMLELADDIDISVAVCALRLVKQLLRHQLVPDVELGSLYNLLIDDSPDIRSSIGELVYDHLIAQTFNSSQSRSTGDDSDSSEIHLGRTLQILREFSGDQTLCIYFIDDVWEYTDAMKDWKHIISMLLDENPFVELTDEDATNLILLLCASVKKAVGERIVPATDYRKQYYSKAQREMIENNRRDITVSMMKNYPQLLRKFMTDKAKVPLLVEVIIHMNLELYSLKRQDQTFKDVVQLIKETFFKHGEKDALRSCVKAINFCSLASRGELQDFAKSKFKELEDDLIAKLKYAMKEVVDSDDEYSLQVNLKRLYELQLIKCVSNGSLYEDILVILRRFRGIDDEVVSFLLLNMFLHVAWCLHSIINSETISEEALSSLLSKRTALFEQLEYFLQTRCEVQEEGQCGNLLACRANFVLKKLENLGYCPDESVLQKYWELCEKQLYISDETEDEDVNKDYVEETYRDAVIIAAAKLVATDAIPKENLGPEIISHFVMHGTRVAEIIKHLIVILKKKDDISNIFLEALKRTYGRHLAVLSVSSDDSLSSKTFQECKDLAIRLSGTFVGGVRNKHRADILKIVKNGIEYAFVDAPKQLSFLEGAVLHFVFKLPTPVILDILPSASSLKDVQKRTENVKTDENLISWRPYYFFVDSLQEKYAKLEGLKDEKGRTSVRSCGRPRKKCNIEGKKLFDERDSSEEDDSISSDHGPQEQEE